jgi:hypothetical protein
MLARVLERGRDIATDTRRSAIASSKNNSVREGGEMFMLLQISPSPLEIDAAHR